DSFEITINIWDADRLAFKYSDLDLFVPGKELQLWMGYHGRHELRLMIDGEITSLRPSFPPSGQPTLTIGGLNLLHRFRGKQGSAAYQQKTHRHNGPPVGTRLDGKGQTDPTPER